MVTIAMGCALWMGCSALGTTHLVPTLTAPSIPTAAIAAVTGDSLSAARRAYVAARLYSAIGHYFAHWDDVPTLDLDEAFTEYLAEAMAAPDRVGFSLASMAFLARFNNQHTWYFDRAVIHGGHHDYEAQYLDGAWVVVRSARDDLRPGDVIAELDGRPFEEFYREHSRYIAASTERTRRRLIFRPWWRGIFPLRYTVALSDGHTVTVDRDRDAPLTGSVVEGRWIDERTAYLKVPVWDGQQYHDSALAYVERFREADGLVIDVRGNRGGGTPARVIAALMDRPWRWWAESTPMHLAVHAYRAGEGGANLQPFARPHMSWPSTTRDADALFAGRLAILIDAACASACEDFVMPFKDNGRAIVIGDSTAGSSGQPYSVSLGDGIQFWVGAKREYFPDGAPFEGVGVHPDLRVVPTIEDLRHGRDPALRRAIEAVTVP
jgi:carboxyl-terminal processing protease